MLKQNDDIYCGVYNSSIIAKNLSRSSERTVQCYEIELFHTDSGTSHINGKAYPIRRGMLLCSKPGQIRFSNFPLKCSFIRVFTSGISKELDDLLKTLPDVRFIDDPEEIERLLGIFAKLGSYFITTPSKSAMLHINSLFFELLYRIVKLDVSTSSDSERLNVTQAIREAREYINENFTGGCTLKDIAKAVNLSPNYLHTAFTRAIGMTPYDYVTSKRIEKAKKLIMSADRSMLEIALEVGFCSQSHFNKVFRKITGSTPAEYRKELFYRY